MQSSSSWSWSRVTVWVRHPQRWRTVEWSPSGEAREEEQGRDARTTLPLHTGLPHSSRQTSPVQSSRAETDCTAPHCTASRTLTDSRLGSRRVVDLTAATTRKGDESDRTDRKAGAEQCSDAMRCYAMRCDALAAHSAVVSRAGAWLQPQRPTSPSAISSAQLSSRRALATMDHGGGRGETLGSETSACHSDITSH